MIDFKKITDNTRLYNFHSHTQFCDGYAPMREFVTAAIDAGFTHYGFSPHSPIPFDSPCNIKEENVAAYLSEFESLKKEFAGKIDLYKSMEIDYIDDNWGPSNPYFDTINLDYKIGSVHFIPHDDIHIDTDGSFQNFKVKMETYFDNDIRHVVESFYNQTLKMIEAGGFDIIGHFDKIGQNAGYFQPGIEDEEWYQNLISKVIDAIKDTGLIAEINTKSLTQHGRFFPGKRYFHILKKYEIPVIINSDAHYPALINAGREEGFDAYYNL